MAWWTNTETFPLIVDDPNSRIKLLTIEMAGYVTVEKCADLNCSTLIAYNAPGGDDDTCAFKADSCQVKNHDYHTLCCTQHKATYVCPDCNDNSEDSQ
jgi:hypothetical protein